MALLDTYVFAATASGRPRGELLVDVLVASDDNGPR
jgi:hypothetical protein